MAVAVVNYNTCRELERCLASIVPEAPDELLVIDNGSTDGSIAMVRRRFPDVRLQVNAENHGYGAAGNQALRLTASDYLLLLNSDTVLEAGSLAALRDYMDSHPQAAVAGPRLVNPNGSLQPSCYPFPTPFQLALGSSGLGALTSRLPGVRNLSLRWWPHDRDRAVPWVLGAALVLRRGPVMALGGFDESFFMYYEEVDLCYRLALADHETHFTPATTIMHVGGASTSKAGSDMTVQWFRSLRHFYRKHYPPSWAGALGLYGQVIASGRWLRARAQMMLRPSERAEHSLLTSRLLLHHVRHAND